MSLPPSFLHTVLYSKTGQWEGLHGNDARHLLSNGCRMITYAPKVHGIIILCNASSLVPMWPVVANTFHTIHSGPGAMVRPVMAVPVFEGEKMASLGF